VYLVSGGDFAGVKLKTELFYLLVVASIMIAAAGYIINDYFDIQIDNINRPGSLIIGNSITPKVALVLYSLFSVIGLLLSGYLSKQLQNAYILFFNFISVLVLLLYSYTFKRKLLIGNLIISALTAWVILVLAVAESGFSESNHTGWGLLLKFSMLYGGFAFIISFIREIVKDMEDINGDKAMGCTTMPIVWGIPHTKIFAGIWMIVLILTISAGVVYLLRDGKWIGSFYGVIFIMVPLIIALRKLLKAINPKDFHNLSTMIKVIMLTGILSMLFIWF